MGLRGISIIAAAVWFWAGALANASAADERVRLAGHVPAALAQASPARASVLTLKSASEPVAVTVVLRRSDPDGFREYLRDVYDPQSPTYRKFLKPGEVADRYGPSVGDVAAVRTYLEAQGLAVEAAPGNRLTMVAFGAPEKLEAALDVSLGRYEIAGRSFRANDRDPSLPPAIASRVEAIAGLSTLAQPQPMIAQFELSLIKAFCSVTGFFAGIGDFWGYERRFLKEFARCLSGAASGLGLGTLTKPDPPPPAWQGVDGTGQTIGIVAFDRYSASDVQDYIDLIGLPSSKIANVTRVPVNGGASFGANQSEVLLDIGLIIGVATNAAIRVYDAPSGGAGSYQAVFNAMINDGVDVISNSWAYCEDQTTQADVFSIETVLQAAAASGISVVSAAGDHGSTCLDGSANTAHVPASAPHVTAVGGTSLTLGPGFTYQSEMWWDSSGATPPGGQGGFGTSRYFARPSYQDGLTAATMRSLPDVSTNADPAKGVMICQAAAGGCPTGLLYGGTSAAAPAIASYVALLNQAQGANLGFLNPSFYAHANTAAFHTPASMGSDFAHVGLGSPNLPQLHRRLTNQTVGTTSASISVVEAYAASNFAMPASVTDGLPIPADGTTKAYIVVRLADAFGNVVSGHTVSLAASGGSAQIAAVSNVSSVNNGAAIFTVTDLTPETLTFTATDVTASVVITQKAKVAFGVPTATGASIAATPANVQNNGVAAATITVTLKDALNRPTPGKRVTLAQGSGHSVVSGPSPSVTDANGQIQFTATNTFAEIVTYTAVDVTDGNLPVPGSGVVNFSGQATATCVAQPPPVGAPGYTLTPYFTGFAAASTFYGNVNWGCRGASDPAFSADGTPYINNFTDGSVFKMPRAGGAATSGNRLSTLGVSLFGPVIGKDGRMYAARGATNGGFFSGAIYELDPNTGAILRTLLSNLTCPTSLVVDPLSGDLFFGDSCFGAGTDNPSLWRVSNPASATPTLSVYTTLPATPTNWIAFAPNGTIYMAESTAGGSGAPVLAISGTNVPGPPTQTPVPGLSTVYWVTVGEVLPNGAAKSLLIFDAALGKVRLADITSNPPVFTDLIVGSLGTGMIGPDGCVYVTTLDAVYRLTSASGACGFASSSPGPQLALSPLTVTPNPAQGSQRTLTATFTGVTVPAGTPVTFLVGGTNGQLKSASTDASGVATMSYTGYLAGTDSIIASAVVNGITYVSPAAAITWGAGAHPTFASVDLAPSTGAVGRAASLVATLVDATTSPSAPIPGAAIHFTIGAQSCDGVTNASGVATCALAPSTPGTFTLTAAYAGNGSFLPTSASRQFSALASTSAVAPLPVVLAFGLQNVGTTSATQAIVYTNAGSATLFISSIAVSGANAGDFLLGSGPGACVVGGNIAANGGTCTVYVAFHPGASGARGATLTLADARAETTIVVPLTGTGFAIAPAVTAIPTLDRSALLLLALLVLGIALRAAPRRA
jgi:kumamolisin